MKPSVCKNIQAKGNNGKSARRRLIRSLLMVSPIGFIIFFFAYKYLGINQLIHSDTVEEIRQVHISGDAHKDIIENYLTMTQLSLTDNMATSPKQMGTNRYGKVYAAFCEIDWDAQARNPSIVPMFRDLEAASPKCRETFTSVSDLYALVQDAKAFDGFDEETQTAKHKGIVFPPNGIVFHETRCGSTLFANVLAGSGSAQGHSRVFSESKPPIAAFQASASGARFDDTPGDENLHSMLIRDVFYMMGRRPPPKKDDVDPTLFFKIQSVGVFSINKFTTAFPDVPWVFVYRNTVEIMQSLLRQGQKTTPKVCTRYRGLGLNRQPATTKQVIKKSGKKFENLTTVEYCAAHLGGLSMAALQEYDQTDGDGKHSSMGRFVEYTQMPDAVWKDILPNHFGVKSLSKDSIANMEKITGVYSKGRGKSADREWNEDSTEKQKSATPEVVQAANLMVGRAYSRMKKLSH